MNYYISIRDLTFLAGLFAASKRVDILLRRRRAAPRRAAAR